MWWWIALAVYLFAGVCMIAYGNQIHPPDNKLVLVVLIWPLVLIIAIYHTIRSLADPP